MINRNQIKVFYDFEFTRIHKGTTPISIGMLTEDGKNKFYAEFTDYDKLQVDEWLKDNVLSKLSLNNMPEGYFNCKQGITEIKGTVPYVVGVEGGLYEWLQNIKVSIVMASYGNGLDIVLLWEIFKIAQKDMPANIYPWGYDVQTLFLDYGYETNIEGIKEQFIGIHNCAKKHNALFDAEVARQIYLKLKMNR